MELLEQAELLHYIVTTLALPGALLVFAYEQRQARRNEEQAIYQSLLDQYVQFMTLVFENPDLGLLGPEGPDGGAGRANLDDQQLARRRALFDILTTLFERAFTLLRGESANPRMARQWSPWEQLIGEWLDRDDFRSALPDLIRGTDRDFQAYMRRRVRP